MKFDHLLFSILFIHLMVNDKIETSLFLGKQEC